MRPSTPRGRNNGTAMKIAPSANSQYSGNATVKKLFAPFTRPARGNRDGEEALRAVPQAGAEDRAGERAAPADRDPDRDLDRVGGRHLAPGDDADPRHGGGGGGGAHER